MVDQPIPEWFHEFEKKALRWRIGFMGAILALTVGGGWFARDWFETKMKETNTLSLENKVTSVHESYLRQDKEIYERLLSIEEQLKIDTSKGKKQLEGIEREIELIKLKRKALASGIVNQEAIAGIIESSESGMNKIRLRQSYGESVDYAFSSDTKVLIMKGGTRIEGSRKDITFGRAVLIMSVLKDGVQEASLVILPSNEK